MPDEDEPYEWTDPENVRVATAVLDELLAIADAIEKEPNLNEDIIAEGAATERPSSGDDLLDRFWTSRTVLTHVRDFARGRRVCPWSTLGATLVRAACHLPPHVYLPPIIGGRVAPNLFCALTGPSGVGKGGSEAAARDAITYGFFRHTDKLSAEDAAALDTGLIELPLGSGEGLARTFTGDIHTALFTAPEIDSLAALFTRQGSTLEGELRKAFMGEGLGFTNAQKATCTYVERLTYRMGLIVGVQPLRAQSLLNGADGGTPQRFIWMPVLDPDRPEQRPETPDPIVILVPDFMPGDIKVPDVAVHAIDAAQAAIHRGDADADPLAAHGLLTRLKVAAALMLLDERLDGPEKGIITDDDWQLAGIVMAISDSTRAGVQQAVAASARSANRARAHAAAEREEVLSERKAQRARDTILRKIDRSGQQTKNQLRMAMKGDIRDYLDAALSDLLDRGEITVSPVRSGTRQVHMYHRSIDQKHGTTSDDGSWTESPYGPSPANMPRQRRTRQKPDRQRTRGKFRTSQQTEATA